MRAPFAMRRIAIALSQAFVISWIVYAAPAVVPYQAIVSMLDRMTAKGVESSLRVVIEVLVIGDDEGGKTAARLIDVEKATVNAAIVEHFDPDSGFKLLGIEARPFASIPANGDSGAPAYAAALAADDKSARSLYGDARFFIMVRIVDYHSGRYDLAETRSQLLDGIGGNKLGLDVTWSSQVDGTERSLFIDGTRIK